MQPSRKAKVFYIKAADVAYARPARRDPDGRRAEKVQAGVSRSPPILLSPDGVARNRACGRQRRTEQMEASDDSNRERRQSKKCLRRVWGVFRRRWFLKLLLRLAPLLTKLVELVIIALRLLT